MKTINFYTTKGDFGCFSNFSRHSVFLKGKTWPTSEHYYQAQKFAGTPMEEKVRKAPNPKAAALMGRDKDNPLRLDWNEIKDDVMREVVRAKFTQNEFLKKKLISTGDALLAEHTVNDKYWGDGGNGTGKNMLGKILMEIRDELRIVANFYDEWGF